ncbi:MAG: citrate lyase subunit alpha [Candidatus Thermoplasmatota archaeon]|nr:citrate lyase subunit alpha [Candidatus Thermoplasmatota archaeon]MBU4256361.1 citrate lyase subunit alpha [Candidatus Thermoplasmatota archaeon]
MSKTISNISKLTDLKTALKKCGLKNGDTISFHHQLRNGDNVLNLTLEAVKELDVKNIRLAQTALFNVHKPVIDYIKDGVVSRIEGSINDVVGDYVSKHPLQNPVILRSHGRRWADVKTGNLHINIAVIAASSSDEKGNCTGITGKNSFGPIIYSQIDAMKADHVIVATDNVVEYPCRYQEIAEGFVDYVVNVDSIGDPENIVSGSTKITDDPVKQQIAHDCVSLMDAAGIIKNGMSFQSGAGGISLAATKYLGEKLKEKNITASFGMGGLTKYLVDIYKTGRVKKLYYAQCFDTEAVKFVSENPGMPIMNIGHYADPTSKSRTVDSLDTVVLGATEVDTKFNVNVNTHSDGRLLHGIGGHQDTAAGAKLTIITAPLYRKKNPIVREKVTTITTPGSVVDAVVTNEGIAINPERKDILEKVKGKINLVSIEELKDMAYAQTGKPESLNLGKEIVAEIKWIDGSVLDRVYRVKGS